MQPATVTLFLGLLCFSLQSSLPNGEITGIIVDERGDPVQGADGCANPLNMASASIVPCGRSDAEGNFRSICLA